MKQPFYFILFIASLVSGCNTSNVDHLLHNAEVVMSSSPDSAKCILESIDFNTILSRREKAKYALLLSQTYDKCYIDVNNDSLIQYAVDYYLFHARNRYR